MKKRVIFVFLLIILSACSKQIEEPINTENLLDITNIDMPSSLITEDTPSIDQATLVFHTDANAENIFRTSAYDFILFFSSKKIKGLEIKYLVKERMFLFGIPSTKTPIINLDGNNHQIAYTFQRNGKQALYFDGRLAGMSDFNDELPPLPPLATGMAVMDKGGFAKTDIDVYDSYMDNNEIKALN